MSSSTPEPAPARGGLRERKKAQTRQRIQDEAMRLFAEQGYETPTIEQIADAADVSPSTFFRYYPTKEDTVSGTRVHSAIAATPPEDLAQARERTLLLRVPALRARSIEFHRTMLTTVVQNLAGKLGREPYDPQILVFAGALAGTLVAVMMAWADREMDLDGLSRLLDRSFDQLAAGVNF